MEAGRYGRKEQVEESWIPKTPFKPILPKPHIMYADKQGFQVTRSTGFSSQGATTETQSACSDSNWEIALQTNQNTREEPWPPVLNGTNMKFTSLLSLQDQQASAALNADYQLQSNGLWSDNFIHNGIATYPGETAESVCHKTTNQMAPVTPHKTLVAESAFSQIEHLCPNGAAREVNDEGSENTAAEISMNRSKTDAQLLELAKSSSGVDSSVITENGNDVGPCETPQQKPRRRKHRPKVITQGKARVRKPATPKPPTPHNQTVKRKYVRKKPLDKTPTQSKQPSTPPTECKGSSTGMRTYVRKKLPTPAMEPTGEPTNAQPPKAANYSCRRSLNFDNEGLAGHVNSGCKPNSDGDPQLQAKDASAGYKSKLTLNFGRGIEVVVEPTCDLSRSIHQMRQKYDLLLQQSMPNEPLAALKSLPEKRTPNELIASMDSLPEKGAQNETLPVPGRGEPNEPLAATNFLPGKRAANEQLAAISQAQKRKLNGECQKNHELRGNQGTTHCAHQKTTEIVFYTRTQLPPRETNAYNWENRTIAKELKVNTTGWEHYIHSNQQNIWSTNLYGIRYNAISAYETVNGKNLTASSTSCVTSLTSSKDAAKQEITGVQRSNMQSSTQVEGQKKKRLRTHTRLRDVASLSKIARGEFHPTSAARWPPMNYNVPQVADTDISHACGEALPAELHKKLRTKKRSRERVPLVNYQSSSAIEQSHGMIMLNNRNHGSPLLIGTSTADLWMSPIIQQLQQLDINRETSAVAYKEHNTLVPYSYSTINEQQNALVLYGRDGTVVPFTGPFLPIKKRQPRPKVDLDQETGRVWRLLIENINSQGIDGTDEEKAKWWKEEREIFRGRANSFIARMHLVQGDRRFTPWKGSVLDSVIGVFLTQNVSDHLSSSAFMSMAANFPLKSTSHEAMRDSATENPIVCFPDLEYAFNMSNQSVCDRSSMILHDSEPDEEREADYSNESSMSSTAIKHGTSGVEGYYNSLEKRSTTDVSKIFGACHIEENRSMTNEEVSSQNSVVSSQNSANSPFAQTVGRNEIYSERDQIDGSKHSCLHSSDSFMELLMKAGRNKLHEVPGHGNGAFLSTQSVENEKCSTYSSKSSSEVFMVQHLTSELKVVEDTRYPEISENNERSHIKEQNSFTSKSANQATDENNLNHSTHEASRYTAVDDPPRSKIQEDMHLAIHSQVVVTKDLSIVEKSDAQSETNEFQQNVILPNLPGKDQDIDGSGRALNILGKDSQKTPESDLTEHGLQEMKVLAAKRKAKSRRVGGEIRDDVDWNALKKEAESNGRKREKTPNTMDSLDWEAVRLADVSKIADTIKERGMNNVLAGRIKDFLNRLAREQGSLDLEWLRDVPPDKAKEYLLTIRGLGLKSVECVRLLTLHHLAFPVDTNVGRIAVRLGWVPLQPLPESLQLHLLELYPVQETIQQYLWPRLCKLDQKTLYELHYQLITFGKVFCTKSKPNCNACPMRGECRHFASAFASARLALPAPEEKSIVSAAKNRTNEPSPSVMVDRLRLPLPQPNEKSEDNQQLELEQLSEVRYEVKRSEPIVEEPSSPEQQCTQVMEFDIEDTLVEEDPDEIPTIKLNIEEFTQNLQTYMQNNMELQEGEMSKALVALTEEAASIPMPKLKNVSRLRTEHHVYELPDTHPLLQGLDRREPDDPSSYLLAIWTPGETANSIQPPESTCNLQEHGKLCDETTCFSCNSVREANSQIVRGTLLIPCRTAMRGSFPLNGTYFQVNEVFADHDSSLNPIDVPRSWLWNLPRRTVYFGTSIPTIFKGLTTEGIQHCFWRGFVCVRGFDQKTRAPRPLLARLHFPASKLNKTTGYNGNE